MKTAIVFYSKHHGNTKKLLDAIAKENDVTLIDVTNPHLTDLISYDRIGLASGIYLNSYAKQLLEFADKYLPQGKEVFYIYTHGAPAGVPLKGIREIVRSKGCKEVGTYHCRGFDTVGPFKLVGGIAKGHPTEKEISGAIDFYKDLK